MSKQKDKLLDITLNGISEATKHLLKLQTKNIPEDKQKLAEKYWDEVSKNIPEWLLLVDNKITPSELRKRYVHSHTNLLNALGIVGHVLISKYPNQWKEKLKGLQQIDWLRTNPIWDGKLIIKGTMIKTKIGIQLAAFLILAECGISEKLATVQVKRVAAR